MMFENKTAWFSDSCPDNVKKLWVENGGKLEDVDLAQYVFSDDWQHDDTKILYNSEAYLKQHLAIFGSQYVTDAVRQGIDNVSLGKYFLIPGPIRDSIAFRNFQTANLVVQNSNVAGPSSKQAQQIPSSENKQNNKRRTGSGISSPTSASSSTEISSAETARILQQPVSIDTGQVTASQMRSIKLTDTRAVNPSISQSLHRRSCREINQIDLDSIPHVQSLPKVISCLRTIYPGRDGVEVKYIT